MYCVTNVFSLLATSKSGKPCDKLIALCLLAKAVIVVNIVVPTLGNLDFMVPGNWGN
jgi:hypothetical protein